MKEADFTTKQPRFATSLANFFFIISYAIGTATKRVENVPVITPSNIAKEKLRIVSPPKIKILSNTRAVLNDVLMVRDSVLLSASLINQAAIPFRIETYHLTHTVEYYHFIIYRVTDIGKNCSNECLVDFHRERQQAVENRVNRQDDQRIERQ